MTGGTAIAFQGAPGAFSHRAALNFAKELGVDAQCVPCQTFGDVFELVESGGAQYGAIPLENSSIGSIVANFDLLWSGKVYIIRESFLPVHHHLIGWDGTRVDDIEAVYSHPAALDQCRRLFKQHKNLSARVHWDTSGAVAYVKEQGDKKCAAIAGELAAAEYGLAILLNNVEDYPYNATRFGLITAAEPKQQVGNKYSYAVELSHQPGKLAALLDALALAGGNLTKIESRPIGETPWHYRFFLDVLLAAPDKESEIDRALKQHSDSHKRLGRYPSAAK